MAEYYFEPTTWNNVVATTTVPIHPMQTNYFNNWFEDYQRTQLNEFTTATVTYNPEAWQTLTGTLYRTEYHSLYGDAITATVTAGEGPVYYTWDRSDTGWIRYTFHIDDLDVADDTPVDVSEYV